MNISQINSTLEVNSSQNNIATPFYNFVPEPQSSRTIRYVIYCIVFIFAIVGNATVCIIPFRHRRMRTCTYFLITNLAVSDIGTMLCLPYILVMEWQNEWSMGSVMCKLVNPSLTMFYLVTTNTLVAIAVHRFVVVVFPFKSKPGKSRVALIILLIWLIAFLCVLPSFGARQLVFNGVKDNGKTSYTCDEIFPGKTREDHEFFRNMYTIFQYVINIFLPIVIIVILYIVIAYKLRQMSSALGFRKDRRDSQGSTSYHSVASRKKSIDDFSLRKRNELERKFLRMLAVVVIVFVLCYVPYTTFYLVVSYYPMAMTWKYLGILYHYIYLLMWFPNALYPICYGALDDRYASIVRSLCCIRNRAQRFASRLASNGVNSSGGRSNRPGHLFSRSNQTLPPIKEKSRTQTSNRTIEEHKNGNGKKWKTCCS